MFVTLSKTGTVFHIASYSVDTGIQMSGCEVANHLRLVRTLRTRGAVPPHLHDVIVNHSDGFSFTFTCMGQHNSANRTSLVTTARYAQNAHIPAKTLDPFRMR